MGDARRFIVEDIVVYSLLALCAGFDFLVNVANHYGIRIFLHELGRHPIQFGAWQSAFVVALALIQLARRLDEKRYY